jgi:tetratricopeptide (TPR) repeat protein
MDDTRDSPTLQAFPGAGRIVGARYAVVKRLGRGATKEVFLAYDQRLDREVALAFIVGAHDATRLQREARVTGRLGDHPNVITVYDTTELDGLPCLVLRAMTGGSLADALADGPLDAPAALRIGRDVASALAHAHAHGVIHRDVKPGNVWLTGDGQAALGDFGVAREANAQRLTEEGVVVGTPRYLSPEQRNGAEAGPASDLYALGVTLREMVSEGPPALDRLVAELTAEDPLQRPPSAGNVAQRLAAITLEAPPARRVVAVLAARADAEDPELLHAALAGAAAQIAEHGGMVERSAGDSLIALFALEEAARAVRAALALPHLRVGLEAGEVFAGAGAPVATALRLAEQAAPGEIRLGQAIRAALPPATSVEPATGRLLRVAEPSLLERADTPFVGRAAELEALELAFAPVAAERVCRRVTVMGVAGIGKSRLAAEFAAALGERAAVLAGRCPAFGEGTTYQAFADMLGGQPDEAVRRVLLGAREPVSVEETAWTIRRWLERLAHERPLVLVIEDIHWAEPPLLDAIEHVVALSSGSPILVVCLARPELLETRPAWSTPQRNRTLVVLEALTEADAIELARALGVGAEAERIAARAEGNPLFVEQLVAVAGEQDLPISIQAVLAARIDRLDPGERLVLQRASVEGRSFHAGDLPAGALVGLVRKGLIAPDSGEDMFRFSHALIREAAYAGLTRRARAAAHAEVAQWLEARDAADAVVAHHLERACGEFRALAPQAVERLTAAARGALSRGDPGAGVNLLERAIALVGAEARVQLLPALGEALFEAGRLPEAERLLDEAIAAAPGPRLRARARVEREFVRLQTEPLAGPSDEVAREALETLDGDALGCCRAWSLRAQVAWIGGQVERADAAWVRAQGHADERQRFAIVRWRATAAVFGPAPVDEAIERCEGFRDELAASGLAVVWAVNPLATLHALRGDLDLAERYLREANAELAELGGILATVNHLEALLRLQTGEPERAEEVLRPGADALEQFGDGGLLATTNAMLAQALYAQGRDGEAKARCEVAARAGAADDIVTQVIWRGVTGKILARTGDRVRGEALAREAVALVEPTDLLIHKGDVFLDLAETLQGPEADAVHTAGLAFHRQKRGL